MIYSVGVVELKSIAKGIEACDDALKSAGIRLVTAHTACPGKYEIVLTGELADVQTAVDRIKANYGNYVIDGVMLGRIDETVVNALLGTGFSERRGAIGIIETFSAASAVKAADTAVKTADVEIYDLRISRGQGGKGVVIITGQVSDVTASVEAGGRYAETLGLLHGTSVLANPHPDVWDHL